MDSRWKFNTGIKPKTKQKSKCIEKYLALIFLVSDKLLYAAQALYIIIFLDKLNIFYRLKVIGFKTEMSRSKAQNIVFFLHFFYHKECILNKTKLLPFLILRFYPVKRHNILVSKSLQCCSSNT